MRQAVAALVWTERAVFFIIGLLMFAACGALIKEAVIVLASLWGGGANAPIAYGSQFLDVILLVLMIVELAYTVILSLRGAVLLAEPFLIVGLIAVIRRILVITVGEVKGSFGQDAAELGILTGVVVVLVLSIFVLRLRPRPDGVSDEDLTG